MNKLLLVILAVVLARSLPGESRPAGFDIHTYLPLTQAMDEFNHKLAGCSKEAVHIEECNPRAGIFDAKLWKKVRKLAKQAFDLQEKAQVTALTPGSAKD